MSKVRVTDLDSKIRMELDHARLDLARIKSLEQQLDDLKKRPQLNWKEIEDE